MTNMHVLDVTDACTSISLKLRGGPFGGGPGCVSVYGLGGEKSMCFSRLISEIHRSLLARDSPASNYCFVKCATEFDSLRNEIEKTCVSKCSIRTYLRSLIEEISRWWFWELIIEICTSLKSTWRSLLVLSMSPWASYRKWWRKYIISQIISAMRSKLAMRAFFLSIAGTHRPVFAMWPEDLPNGQFENQFRVPVPLECT